MTILKPVVGGSCLCGGVQFEVHGVLRPVIACHCLECRKMSGHYTAATACKPTDLSLSEQRSLTWYRASKMAERGFCCECGATLFWKPSAGDRISIYAGCLDDSTGQKVTAHIFVGEKADYYEIDDGLPQFEKGGASLEIQLACLGPTL